MARVRSIPEPQTVTEVVFPVDSAALIYRDKSGRSRASVVTEGGANLPALVAQHQADEAERLRKEAEAEASK